MMTTVLIVVAAYTLLVAAALAYKAFDDRAFNRQFADMMREAEGEDQSDEGCMT